MESCCPKFDTSPWDDKIIQWENKLFIKDSVCTFLYMPLNFGAAMKRLNACTTKAGAEMVDYLCLSEHASAWKMDLFLAVDKEIPEAKNTTLTGKFYTKVFEGPFQNAGKWSKEFDQILQAKKLKNEKIYFWYTTCPKCAKIYGKNYVVLFAKIE